MDADILRIARISFVPERLDGKLGKTVRAARSARGWTIAGLSRRAGVSKRHLSAMELGANVSAAVIIRVAQTLGLAEVDIGGVLVSVERSSFKSIDIVAALSHLDEIERRGRLARRDLGEYNARQSARRRVSSRKRDR
jgi:transcriptional regulator with XRE-family HTH domain